MSKNTLLLLALLLSANCLFAQDLDYPRLGVGMQANFPAGGLSVKADLTEIHSAQAVIGLFGPFSSFYGRYLYNFTEKGEEFRYKPYGYGQVGVYSYDFQEFSGFEVVNDTESAVGFGFGAGVEGYFLPLSDRLRFNLEIGFGNVAFEHYDFNAFSLGGGIHYYFDI